LNAIKTGAPMAIDGHCYPAVAPSTPSLYKSSPTAPAAPPINRAPGLPHAPRQRNLAAAPLTAARSSSSLMNNSLASSHLPSPPAPPARGIPRSELLLPRRTDLPPKHPDRTRRRRSPPPFICAARPFV
jgi:hypothetical protein